MTTETIVSLFSNYPNNSQTHQPVDTKGEPIGLNIGIVNHISKPHWPFPESPVRTDRNISNINNFSNREYVLPSLSHYIDWYPNQKKQEVHIQNKASKQHQLKNKYFEPIDIKHNMIRPLIKPLKSSNFDSSSLHAYDIIASHPEKDTWDFKEEKYIVPLNPYRNKANHFNDNMHEDKENLPKRLSTFDDWFKEQMVAVENQKMSKGVNKIDSDGLRSLVLKTLLENHYHLSAKGMMVDDSGTPMDLNNLELRPILVGSAVKFKSLELIPQITFPETLPYLQGILIILIHPFRILGVIPVGKTYVSSPDKAKNPSLKHVETVESFPKIPLHSQATVISTNPFKLLEQRVSSVPSLFSENQKLHSKLDLKPLDSEIIKFPNIAVEKPFTFGTNDRWNTLTNSRLDYKRPGGQFPHLKVSPIKNDLNFINKWNLVSDSGPKQYSSLDIFAPENGNPHLTAIPLQNKVPSHFTQSNRDAQNLNAFPSNSQVGATSNSFWNQINSADTKNPLLKPDLSSHHLIHTSITEMSESPFNSGKSNLKLVVNPLNKDLDSRRSQQYSPGFNSKYVTVGPDVVGSNTWVSFSNSGSGYSNSYPNTQHIPRQESSWFSDRWGDAIMKSIPSVINSEVTGIEIPNWINSDDSHNQPLLEDDTLLGPTRRVSSPVVKGVLKTLIQMIIENFVNKNNQEGKPEKEGDKTETSEVKVNDTVGKPNALRQAGNDDNDGPDFRIIGGSAVTGSGSPLSNKGRSGLSIV